MICNLFINLFISLKNNTLLCVRNVANIGVFQIRTLKTSHLFTISHRHNLQLVTVFFQHSLTLWEHDILCCSKECQSFKYMIFACSYLRKHSNLRKLPEHFVFYTIMVKKGNTKKLNKNF